MYCTHGNRYIKDIAPMETKILKALHPWKQVYNRYYIHENRYITGYTHYK